MGFIRPERIGLDPSTPRFTRGDELVLQLYPGQ